MFENITMAPADPILGLTDAFKKDTNPQKINIGVGVYKDEVGNTPILKSVKQAEKILLDEEKTKTYLSIQGTAEYGKCVQELIFGKSNELLTSNRAVTVQAPGGTGALRIAGDFMHKFFPNAKVWLSDPTWPNHNKVFDAAGLETRTYSYYDSTTNGLNFDKMLKSLSTASPGDIIVLHACCHNPTGVDLSNTQWLQLVDIIEKQNLLPLFDFAYQGFGSGLDEDAFAIRTFAKKIKNFFVANSFSKNFGLYNERVGALTLVTESADEAAKAFSQLKICVRANFSNPPAHGAAVVTKILSTPELRKLWMNEVTEMRERIHGYRDKFVAALKAEGIKQNFDFIRKQRGMFSYTGLSVDQVLKLRSEYSIFFANSGRISLAGVNDKNINRLCHSFAEVLTNLNNG